MFCLSSTWDVALGDQYNVTVSKMVTIPWHRSDITLCQHVVDRMSLPVVSCWHAVTRVTWLRHDVTPVTSCQYCVTDCVRKSVAWIKLTVWPWEWRVCEKSHSKFNCPSLQVHVNGFFYWILLYKTSEAYSPIYNALYMLLRDTIECKIKLYVKLVPIALCWYQMLHWNLRAQMKGSWAAIEPIYSMKKWLYTMKRAVLYSILTLHAQNYEISLWQTTSSKTKQQLRLQSALQIKVVCSPIFIMILH